MGYHVAALLWVVPPVQRRPMPICSVGFLGPRVWPRIVMQYCTLQHHLITAEGTAVHHLITAEGACTLQIKALVGTKLLDMSTC